MGYYSILNCQLGTFKSKWLWELHMKARKDQEWAKVESISYLCCQHPLWYSYYGLWNTCFLKSSSPIFTILFNVFLDFNWNQILSSRYIIIIRINYSICCILALHWFAQQYSHNHKLFSLISPSLPTSFLPSL